MTRGVIADNSQQSIDYESTEGIADFNFPASWNSPLPLTGYVEAIMHSLTTGCASWNFKAIQSLLTQFGVGAAFVNNANVLLSYSG